jgi:biopolymer transport protein ExbD
MKWTKRTFNEPPEINLTPLIDVVFMILILFILIAPLINTETIELFPKASSTKMINFEDQAFKIYIFKDNTIWLNKQKLNSNQLKTSFFEAKRNYPNKTPLLLCDNKAYFETYLHVKSALEEAGYEQMEVVRK